MILLYEGQKKVKFVDASNMENITYTFPGYDSVVVTGSLMIAAENDYHRIWDGKKGHLIPPTWIHMEWDVPDGSTVFKF